MTVLCKVRFLLREMSSVPVYIASVRLAEIYSHLEESDIARIAMKQSSKGNSRMTKHW